MKLYTIGHGTRAGEEFLRLLKAHGVTRLLDVRTAPGSRLNPQFGMAALQHMLERQGITYEHHPELGGFRKGLGAKSPNTAWKNESFRGYADYMLQDEFWKALDAVLAKAANEPLAVMCSETLWWRCHRRLIADAATARGADVRHIMRADLAEAHRLMPPARISGDRVAYSAASTTSSAAGAERGEPSTS
ncbi:DUF488 domain-containing protein [bacterium]|nr:MAG: DUF488 domain-containing protein [bacterium]